MILVLVGLWFPLVNDKGSEQQKLVCPHGGEEGAEEQLEVREQEAKTNSLSVLSRLIEESPAPADLVRSQPWV